MQNTVISQPPLSVELEQSENSYFGNPYQLKPEQSILEHLSHGYAGEDEIERVVILGYN